MGTDIHMNVERFEGPSKSIGDLRVRRIMQEQEGIPQDTGGWQLLNCPVWRDRSYVTFAVLANVRNGFGVAGCKTHTPVTPIAMPRGVPGDVGPWYDEDGSGFDHTPTWLLLSEVLAYEWDREIVRTGIVPLANRDGHPGFSEDDSLERMLAEGRSQPLSWSGGIMGRNITTVSYPKGRALLLDPDLRSGPETRYYVEIAWLVKLADACAPFLSWARELTRFGDPERIRLVFGFDS